MLTDTELKGAKPGPKAFKLYDREGLFALVKPNGSKLWRFRYVFNGKERLMALGEYPVTKLAEARALAFDARKMLATGIDPMAVRKKQKATQTKAEAAQLDAEQSEAKNTFAHVALLWHRWWSKGVDVDTAAYIMRRLESDVFPAFGSTAVTEIKAADIRQLILSIQKRGARDVAQRVHGMVGQVFRYAVAHEMAEFNPATYFKPGDVLEPRKSQHRAHIKPSELPSLLVAMDDYNGQPIIRLALKLMAMLFVRTSELLEAPWSEFDLPNARWTITAERMKMDKPHIVPLTTQSLEILHELKRLAGNKAYVFPGLNKQTADRFINCNSLLNALEDIGYKGVMTGHGYRGLARTILAENGFDREHLELQLSHVNGDKVQAAYNHAKFLTQRAALMQWWADYLDQQLAAGRNKVVSINDAA